MEEKKFDIKRLLKEIACLLLFVLLLSFLSKLGHIGSVLIVAVILYVFIKMLSRKTSKGKDSKEN